MYVKVFLKRAVSTQNVFASFFVYNAYLLDITPACAYAENMDNKIYEGCLAALHDELVPAMGCTEPVAVAYAAALARKTLGALPQSACVSVSGNILKNVKSVIVPNTGGMRGIAAATAAGIISGRADLKLEVLSVLNEEGIKDIKDFLASHKIAVEQSQSGCVFDIGVTLKSGGDEASVRITGDHTNVVRIERCGEVVFDKEVDGGEEGALARFKSEVCVKDIVEFVDNVKLSDIEPLISRQIELNGKIAEEGLKNDYGARIGRILIDAFGTDVHNLAKATAAAGSDARMNGCELPVVIVSGSGNQGMTASLPVVVYAKHLGASREKLIRAVALSDLITIHLKAGIGCLSAYCGAVSAGCGAGAGVCYLRGGGFDEIAHTVVNALAIQSGVICDGAKSSCAAKVASAVEAGLVAMEMYSRGSQFLGGDGILEKGVENTIRNVGELARNGMRETDAEIIRMMIKSIR